MKRFVYILLGLLLFLSCTSSGLERIENGIIVRLKQNNNSGVKAIRLQVVNNQIIHVSVTGQKDFSNEKSLITKPDLIFSNKFNVEEKEEQIILSTDSLDVTIHTTSGEIAFLNKKGEILLQERKGGGKSLTPIVIEG